MKVVNTCLLTGGLAALVACGGRGDDDQRLRKAPVPKLAPKAPAAASVSGRLTDKTTSLALANVKVTAQAVNAPRILDSAVTQADGTYTLANLPLGVPLRVVSQPVTGAVVYGTAMSEPITLVKDAAPRKLDLAFTTLPLGGAVEGRLHPAHCHAMKGGLTLVQKVVLPDGKTVKAVVRTAPHRPGTFRFEALQPGDYELFYVRSSVLPMRPGQPLHTPPFLKRSCEVTVKAGETAHVTLTRAAHPAADMAEEAETE